MSLLWRYRLSTSSNKLEVSHSSRTSVLLPGSTRPQESSHVPHSSFQSLSYKIKFKRIPSLLIPNHIIVALQQSDSPSPEVILRDATSKLITGIPTIHPICPLPHPSLSSHLTSPRTTNFCYVADHVCCDATNHFGIVYACKTSAPSFAPRSTRCSSLVFWGLSLCRPVVK